MNMGTSYTGYYARLSSETRRIVTVRTRQFYTVVAQLEEQGISTP